MRSRCIRQRKLLNARERRSEHRPQYGTSPQSSVTTGRSGAFVNASRGWVGATSSRGSNGLPKRGRAPSRPSRVPGDRLKSTFNARVDIATAPAYRERLSTVRDSGRGMAARRERRGDALLDRLHSECFKRPTGD
jgi:hypothetical protein